MAIKSTLVTPPNKAKGIDYYTEGHLLIDEVGQVLLTTKDPECFIALVTTEGNKHHLLKPDLGWVKNSFHPITTPITITFENE